MVALSGMRIAGRPGIVTSWPKNVHSVSTVVPVVPVRARGRPARPNLVCAVGELGALCPDEPGDRQQDGDGEHLRDHLLHEPHRGEREQDRGGNGVDAGVLRRVQFEGEHVESGHGSTIFARSPISRDPPYAGEMASNAPGERPITLSPGGLPSTVLPPADPEAEARLAAALAAAEPDRKRAVSEVVAAYPRDLAAWASLGDLGDHTIERYAAYRVGYHRGLDALRANGWRGSGYVRWSEPTNRGFLRALRGLQAMAAEIGERDEAERCAQFLTQLDPTLSTR